MLLQSMYVCYYQNFRSKKLMRSFVLQQFMLDDIGALQWKLAPPLEGEEEKDEVEINEMLAEIESYAQRIEDLAIEVIFGKSYFVSLH